ncbi:MAG: nucleotidyltransferase family protein [Thermoplasmatota archaeon]
MESTTLELPAAVRDRLRRLKSHPRQAYHEVISRALDALETSAAPSAVPPGSVGLDPLVARHKAAILRAVKANKGRRAWLFGSRARGDARPDSDVDLLVEMAPGSDLFDMGGMWGDLEEILPVPFNLVSVGGLKGRFKENVLRERVAI